MLPNTLKPQEPLNEPQTSISGRGKAWNFMNSTEMYMGPHDPHATSTMPLPSTPLRNRETSGSLLRVPHGLLLGSGAIVHAPLLIDSANGRGGTYSGADWTADLVVRQISRPQVQQSDQQHLGSGCFLQPDQATHVV